MRYHSFFIFEKAENLKWSSAANYSGALRVKTTSLYFVSSERIHDF